MVKHLLIITIVLMFLTNGCSDSKSETVTIQTMRTFTATGDDGTVGTASQYDLRYSTNRDSLTNHWGNCSAIPGLPTPNIAGTAETLFINLTVETDKTYFFAIKAADEVPNWSVISNIMTLSFPDITAPSAIIDLGGK